MGKLARETWTAPKNAQAFYLLPDTPDKQNNIAPNTCEYINTMTSCKCKRLRIINLNIITQRFKTIVNRNG